MATPFVPEKPNQVTLINFLLKGMVLSEMFTIHRMNATESSRQYTSTLCKYSVF